MEEKRKDLISTKQKELLAKLLVSLQSEHPNFYYLSTTEIAYEILEYSKESSELSREERSLITDLSMRDVQILLSLNNK